MKSKEELNALKEEVKALNAKLSAPTEEELAQVTGGVESRDVPDMHGHVVSSYESTVNIILDGHKHEEYGAICHRRITPNK